jgi:hypothetical protein
MLPNLLDILVIRGVLMSIVSRIYMYSAFLLNMGKWSRFLNNSSIASAILASSSLGNKVNIWFVQCSTYKSTNNDNLSLYGNLSLDELFSSIV